MNKLFSKIAALSVGLAMAVGVGVALGHQGVKEARAADGSYTISFSTKLNGVTYMDSDGGSALNSTKIINGTTFSSSGKTIEFTSTGFDNVSSVDELTNVYPGRGDSIKVGKGGGDGVFSFTYSGNVKLTKVSITAFALADGVKLTVSDIEGSQTVANGYDNADTYEFTYPDSYSGKSLTVTGGNGKTSSGNKPAYVQSITVEYLNVTEPSITSQENVSVGVGMSVEVPVSYANLASAISVTAPTGVTVPSSIDVTGSGDTTLEIQGDVAGNVDVVLSSGSASATIHVTVIQPTEYTLLTNLNSFTEGSQFTIVSLHEDTYYAPNSFGGNCYNMAEVNMMGEGTNKHFSSINAITYTLVGFDEQGALIKEGDDYVGSTKIDGAGLTRNSDLNKITYNHWAINDIEEEIADLCLVGEDGDNNRFIKFNYNNGNPRIANYKTGFGSGVSIYASYLAPALYAADSIRISTSESHNAFVTAVNFGGETITYNVSVEDESVATAVWSTDHAAISPVAAGNTTVTISAQSASHSPVEVEIPLEVYDATRELESITLSVAEETLYKGQEFSYSGTVTANYSNGDHEAVLNPTFTGQDMSAVGDYEVTVSYTDAGVTKTATYTLHVVSWTGVLSLNRYYVLAAMKTVDEVTHLYTMVGLNKSGTNHYGVAAENEEMLSRTESALYVEEGATYNSYAFRLGNGKYLGINKEANVLTELDEINESSSFTVGVIGETGYSITNVAYSDRSIKFNPGTSTTAPRFSTYTSGQIDVNLFQVTSTDIASHFEANFMHIEIPTDNHEDTNACRAEGEGAQSYYALAKAAFNVMPLESRQHFLANSNYASRLEAWAIANGDEINTDSQLVPSTSESFFSSTDMNNNSYIIIIVISSVSVLSFGLALFLRKKRSK